MPARSVQWGFARPLVNRVHTRALPEKDFARSTMPVLGRRMQRKPRYHLSGLPVCFPRRHNGGLHRPLQGTFGAEIFHDIAVPVAAAFVQRTLAVCIDSKLVPTVLAQKPGNGHRVPSAREVQRGLSVGICYVCSGNLHEGCCDGGGVVLGRRVKRRVPHSVEGRRLRASIEQNVHALGLVVLGTYVQWGVPFLVLSVYVDAFVL